MIARLRQLRRNLLGINRRNHDLLFGFNARQRYRVADDKCATKTLLARHGIPTPVLHATCTGHWDVERIGGVLRSLPACVLKPARGAGGAGIVVLTAHMGEAFVTASGHHRPWADLATHITDVLGGVYAGSGLGDALLVEALVRSEATLAALAHQGVPDVRVLVFRGVPLLAMLRLPTRSSDGRANLHLGGVGVGVDLASGYTTTAIRHGRRVTAHPDRGHALAGIRIPAWETILLLAVQAADAAGLGFVGVDIVVDADHGPLVLELNARPGLGIQAANATGLRPLVDAVATRTVPPEPAARVRLGQHLQATNRSGT